MADRKRNTNNPADLLDLVKAYVKQETLGPLKGVGRFVGFGVAGAVLLGIGLTLVALALLRFLQTETGSPLTGNWSWVPYLVVIVALGILIGLSVAAIRRTGLDRKERA